MPGWIKIGSGLVSILERLQWERAMANKSIWLVARGMLVGMLLVMAAPVAMAMDSGTDEPSAEYLDGVKAVKAGNYAAALPLFQQVVSKNADNADAWNYIGYSHRNLKQFDQALTAYQKALAIKPQHKGANEYLGELYLQTGKLGLAKERLKVLDSACFFGCEEFDELKAAIAAYEAKIN